MKKRNVAGDYKSGCCPTTVYIKKAKPCTTNKTCSPCSPCSPSLTGMQNDTVSLTVVIQDAIDNGILMIPCTCDPDTNDNTTYEFVETDGVIVVTPSDGTPQSSFDICQIVADNCPVPEFESTDNTVSVVFDATTNTYNLTTTHTTDTFTSWVDNGDTYTFTDPNGNTATVCKAPCIDITSTDGSVTVTEVNNVFDLSVIHPGDQEDGTFELNDGSVIDVCKMITDGECESKSDTVVVTDNGDYTQTITHTTADGTVESWCVPDTCNLPPIFAVDYTEPESQYCGGTFELSAGGDTQCPIGQTLYTLTSIPAGYVATVDSVSGTVTWYREETLRCGADCPPCTAQVLQFGYDLVSDCGTESAVHNVTVNPPPTGDITVDKKMEWVKTTDGSQPTQAIITISAFNAPTATGNITSFVLTDVLDDCFIYTTDSTLTAGTPSIGTTTVTGNTLVWDSGAIVLAPNDGEALQIFVNLNPACTESYIPNTVTGVGIDESGNTHTDSAPDILPIPIYPISRVITQDPNPNTGTVDFTYIPTKSDGSPITTCETGTLSFDLVQAGTNDYAVIQGDICQDLSTWTLVSGFDIIPYLSGIPLGGTLTFDKRTWAEDTGHIYAATGQSILNGNQPITDLNATNRTYAQDIIINPKVGGNGSTTCPLESVENYSDEINRVTYILGANSRFWYVEALTLGVGNSINSLTQWYNTSIGSDQTNITGLTNLVEAADQIFPPQITEKWTFDEIPDVNGDGQVYEAFQDYTQNNGLYSRGNNWIENQVLGGSSSTGQDLTFFGVNPNFTSAQYNTSSFPFTVRMYNQEYDPNDTVNRFGDNDYLRWNYNGGTWNNITPTNIVLNEIPLIIPMNPQEIKILNVEGGTSNGYNIYRSYSFERNYAY